MREREMRERVERFLQTRLRKMLLPATLGLGLAVGACDTSPLDTSDGGDTFAKKDSGTVGMKYMAQIPDAGPDLPPPVPYYGAVILRDAAPDSDRVVALYMAQLPVPRS